MRDQTNIMIFATKNMQNRLTLSLKFQHSNQNLYFIIIIYIQMHQKQSQSSLAQVKFKVKVVFLGEQSTGKTSILMRFMNDKFQQGLGATVGIDFMGKNLMAGNHHLRLQLWDTAGQERFRSLIPSYLKDAMITFIVFDLSNKKSFVSMNQWIDLCQTNRNQKNIIIILGNKNDLTAERQVTQQEIDQKIKSLNNPRYFQVSAKSGYNVREAIQTAGQDFVHLHMLQNQLSINHMFDQKLKQVKNMQDSPSKRENQNNTSMKKGKQKAKSKQLKKQLKQAPLSMQSHGITLRGAPQKSKKKKGCC